MKSGGSNFWNSQTVPLVEPETLSQVIAAASDLALVVDQNGAILSVLVNQAAENISKLDHWEGRPMIEFLADDSIRKFADLHGKFLAGDRITKPIELNHVDTGQWSYPLRYTVTAFGPDNHLLMLGRDLSPIAETQQQLVQAQIALEQGYEARREFDSRYRVMLANSNEAILFVTLPDGRIADCTDIAAEMLGLKREAAAGSTFAQLLQQRSSAELMESMLTASMAETGQVVEVVSARTARKLSVHPKVFRSSGQRVLYCRMEGLGDTPKLADADSARAAALVRAIPDAIVFTAKDGTILSTNDSFLDMIGAAHYGDVKNKSLSEVLVRGQIDLNVLTEAVERSGQMRIFPTKLLNELGSRVSVEISATQITDTADPVMAFVIRDISRIESVRGGTRGPMTEDNNRNVMELVGSTPLKDIVAETTDVVEKMCIETAVSLTKNNRVAAAEMLGLSRQSLYVKLRKYGLLSKES